nr:MAG TPA: peptidase [Caudoviricetes sp.]
MLLESGSHTDASAVTSGMCAWWPLIVVKLASLQMKAQFNVVKKKSVHCVQIAHCLRSPPCYAPGKSQERFFMHYTEARWSGKWPNFTPKEIACKCCGEIVVDEASMDALQRLRDMWGEPLVINCGHRCFRHNKEVGGVAHSQHLTLAFDVRMPKERHEAFIKLARKCGFRGIGHRDYENFVHLDMGPEREW